MFACAVDVFCCCCCCCKNVYIVYECCLGIKLRHGPYIKNFHIDLQRCLLYAMQSFSTSYESLLGLMICAFYGVLS